MACQPFSAFGAARASSAFPGPMWFNESRISEQTHVRGTRGPKDGQVLSCEQQTSGRKWTRKVMRDAPHACWLGEDELESGIAGIPAVTHAAIVAHYVHHLPRGTDES